MDVIQFHVQFWGPAALYCIALLLTISIPGLRAKSWLVAFLLMRLAVTAYIYTPQLLMRNEWVTPETFRAVLTSGVQNVVNILSYAVLVGFAMAMTPKVVNNTSISKVLFSFSGRVTRQVFWIVSMTLLTVNVSILLPFASLSSSARPSSAWAIAPWVICLLWAPVSIWIGLATQIKRWHDRDKSGWWALIGLVPIIGEIWATVELGFLRGTRGRNRFGAEADVVVQEAVAHA